MYASHPSMTSLITDYRRRFSNCEGKVVAVEMEEHISPL